MHNFKLKNLDYRSTFANDISMLILKSNNYEIDKSLEDAPKFLSHLEENVRNIYELYDSEIPFFSLYKLRKLGVDNYDYTDYEFKKAEINCIEAINDMVFKILSKEKSGVK